MSASPGDTLIGEDFEKVVSDIHAEILKEREEMRGAPKSKKKREKKSVKKNKNQKPTQSWILRHQSRKRLLSRYQSER
jgi:hypothetical protein